MHRETLEQSYFPCGNTIHSRVELTRVSPLNQTSCLLEPLGVSKNMNKNEER